MRLLRIKTTREMENWSCDDSARDSVTNQLTTADQKFVQVVVRGMARCLQAEATTLVAQHRP